jgi:hypothetical protein
MTQDTLAGNSTVEMLSLEELFENSDLRCPGWATADKLATTQPCGNEATHVVRCPCGAGAIPICDQCLAHAGRRSRRTRFWHRGADMSIWFRGHCEHMVNFHECIIHPI